jgi:hypothetical protein
MEGHALFITTNVAHKKIQNRVYNIVTTPFAKMPLIA